MAALHKDAWVLVCDGRKALFLHNKGDAIAPALETLAALSHDDAPSHELGTDKPGRTFSSAGGGHSAIEPADLHDLAEQNFLKHVAERIDREIGAGRAKHLVLVAPPRALAVLRRELGPQAHATIAAEFDKDLVKMPVHEIEKHLKKMLAEKL